MLVLSLVPVSPVQAQNARQRLAALEQRARADSNDPVVHHQLAAEYFRQKKWDLADSSWHRALALSPHYAEPMLGLALLPIKRYDNHWIELRRQKGEAYIDSLFQASLLWIRRAFVADPMVDLALFGEYKPHSELVIGNLVLDAPPPWGTRRDGRHSWSCRSSTGSAPGSRFTRR